MEQDGAQTVAQGPIIQNFAGGNAFIAKVSASQCRRNPNNKGLPGVGGVVKKAGAEGEGGRLTKAD